MLQATSMNALRFANLVRKLKQYLSGAPLVISVFNPRPKNRDVMRLKPLSFCNSQIEIDWYQSFLKRKAWLGFCVYRLGLVFKLYQGFKLFKNFFPPLVRVVYDGRGHVPRHLISDSINNCQIIPSSTFSYC